MTEYIITETGIHIDGNPTEDHYKQTVAVAVTMKNSAMWSLGDLYVIGSEKFDQTCDQYFDESRVSLATIRNYATVSRAFSPARRRPNLSFSHFREVMTIKDDDGNPLTHIQDELLRQAEVHNWNRDKMRDEVAEVRGKKPIKKTIEAQVGIIDTMLQKDYGLKIGDFVKVTISIETIADTELEKAG